MILKVIIIKFIKVVYDILYMIIIIWKKFFYINILESIFIVSLSRTISLRKR